MIMRNNKNNDANNSIIIHTYTYAYIYVCIWEKQDGEILMNFKVAKNP